MKAIIIYVSIHHGNTEKVANVMTNVLGADLRKVGAFDPKNLAEYDLVGFGSGIFYGKHHKSLLEMIANMPNLNKKAFIFSTSGDQNEKRTPNCHQALRVALQNKGLTIIDEFNCPGYDTFILGGISKGRPNEEDLNKAQAFAENLKNKL
ncbi:MAG: flavodoxin family protein [Nitrososphaeria archaeon]|jgi:flavodoxin